MEINTRNRTDLKQYFVKNAIPTEKNFGELIDGMLNQKEDGIAKLPGNPLSIEASGDDTSQKKAIHFYNTFTDTDPTWVLSLNPRHDPAKPETAKPGFSIGDSLGNSRLFIDRATGNVGIGTVVPAAKLQVPGGALIHEIGIGTQVHGKTAYPYETIQMNPGHNLRVWFGTNERFVFTTSGRLGINKVPDQELHVYGPSNVDVRVQASDASYIDFGTGKNGHFAFGYGDYPFIFGVNGTEKMRLTSDGNLGVGTTKAPRGRLDVPQGDAWVGHTLNISAASDGTNAGVLNLRNETNNKFWHVTFRAGEEDKLIFWRNNTVNYFPVLKLGMDGTVEATGGLSVQGAVGVNATATTWGGWLEAIRFNRSEHSAITHPGGKLLFGLHSDRNFYFADTDAGRYVAVISPTNGGALGVGTNGAPAHAFHVKSTRSDWQARFENSSSNSNVYLSHGGGYGMHVRTDTASTSNYLLELYNATHGGSLFYVSTSGDVTIAKTLKVSGLLTTNKLRLGAKWVMSGVGDSHGNDGWLRLFGTDEAGYYGGLAAGELYSKSGALSGSDRDLKENIEPLGASLERICRLQAVQFTWKGAPSGAERQMGLVAQDVEAVFPEVVGVGPERMKGIDYGRLVTPLIECIKEQQRQLDDLRREVAALKG